MSDTEIESRQLYTPAMLAELLKIPVRTIRRWQRSGFIRPVEEVMQLPYFDYEGLLVARQLAKWVQQGASVQSIQRQLEGLKHHAGDSLSIQDLPVIADGKKLILRSGDQFLESTGQFRFGFESNGAAQGEEARPATIQFSAHAEHPAELRPGQSPLQGEETTLEFMLSQAVDAEDNEQLDIAVEWYRSALAVHGLNPDICFQIAELLYRQGDVSGARERYFIALELEPTLVEARANLGCVLAESGQAELAIAAFQGALEQFADYADVHFHLARVLDDQGEALRAVEHWRRFLELSPASPWAEEAQQRLDQLAPLLEF